MEGEDKKECVEKEKIFSAKRISKFFKIISTIGLVACAVLKWIGLLPGATVGEICLVWSVVYGLGAGTIDLNIIFDKFLGVQQ